MIEWTHAVSTPRRSPAPVSPGAWFGRRARWVGLLAVLTFGAGWSLGAEGRLHRATSEFVVHVWGTEAGLPENSATAMAQTPDGYLWFGTFNGLVRFNSLDLEIFDRVSAPALPGAAILNLHVDRGGRLWVSTDRGLAYLNADRQWRRIDLAGAKSGGHVTSFAEDRQGRLALGTFDQRLFLLPSGKEKASELPVPPVSAGAAFYCYFDADNVLWLACRGFLGRYVQDRWAPAEPAVDMDRFLSAAPSRDGGLWVLDEDSLRKLHGSTVVRRVALPRSLQPWSLYEDRQNNLWVASYAQGVFRIDPQDRCTAFTSADTLTYDAGRFVFQDLEGNYWVGTSGGGLHRLKPSVFRSFSLPGNRLGRVTASILETAPDHFLVGTFGEGTAQIQGIAQIQAGSLSLNGMPRGIQSQFPHAFPLPYVWTLAKDADGRCWIGAAGDGLFRWDGADAWTHVETNGQYRAILADHRGRLWVGSNEGLRSSPDGVRFERHGPEQGFTARDVRCLADDPRRGCLWIGTDDGGLFRHRAGRFEPVPVVGPAAEQIRSLHVDSLGELWVGSFDRGLARYQESHLVWLPGSLLPVRQINCILEDASGHFWLGSNRGIVLAERAELEAAVSGRADHVETSLFGLDDGLRSVEIAGGHQNCALRDSVGRLWFCSYDGVAMVDPRRLQFNEAPPPVRLEKWGYVPAAHRSAPDSGHAATEDVMWVRDTKPGSIGLPAGSRRFEFHYIGLKYAAPGKVRYEYRLEGQDESWIYAANRRVAYYQDLPPGTYRFLVRAACEGGPWSEPLAGPSLHIPPFFWQTTWFRALLVLLLSGGLASAVAAYYRLRLREREERLRQQEALAAERARTAALIDHASDIVQLLDAQGRVLFESPSAARVLGFEPGSGVGNDPQERVHPEDRERLGQALRQVLNGAREVSPIPYRSQHARGHWLHLETVASNLLDQPGVGGILLVTRDITERKSLEAQLLRAQRVETVGRLADGVAHDLNNILSPILMSLETLSQSPLGKEHQETLDLLRTCARRGAQTVKQLLVYSRGGSGDRHPLHIGALFDELAHLIRDTFPKSIRLQVRLARDLRPVVGDATQLMQLMLNLCVNARDAMPHGGLLSLAAENWDLSAPEAAKQAETVPGIYVLLSVTDTGHGIPSEILERIFDPFFTTKEVGKGTGLGLSTVLGIAEGHGGFVRVRSRRGQGAEFRVALPAAPAGACPPSPSPESTPRGAGQRLLLVDDDAAVRLATRSLLENHGYRVWTANDGLEALALYAHQPQGFDAVLLDLWMPFLDGLATIRELHKLNPNVRLLILTGLEGQAAEVEKLDLPIQAFLPKPVTPERLLTALGRALTGGAKGS